MIKNAAIIKHVPFTRVEQAINPYLGFGTGTRADDRRIIEYAKNLLAKKKSMIPKPDPYDKLKRLRPLEKKGSMNYEQIKQAACIDELNKIALSQPLINRANEEAVMRVASADNNNKLNKSIRQMSYFSDRTHDMYKKKLNTSLNDDIADNFKKVTSKVPSYFKVISKTFK